MSQSKTLLTVVAILVVSAVVGWGYAHSHPEWRNDRHDKHEHLDRNHKFGDWDHEHRDHHDWDDGHDDEWHQLHDEHHDHPDHDDHHRAFSSKHTVKGHHVKNDTTDTAGDLQSILDGVSSSDKKSLALLWSDEAYVIANDDTGVIKTTGDIRVVNSTSGILTAMGLVVDGKHKYEGLAEAVDSYLLEALGADNVELTPEMRQKAVDAFDGLSEMAGGAK